MMAAAVSASIYPIGPQIPMVRFFLVGLMMTFASRAVAGNTTHYIRSSTMEDGDLIAEITDDAVADTPAWDAASDNPPVSAKRAIQLAGTVKNALVQDTDDWEWGLESASLRKLDAKWFWVVVYRAAIKRGGLAGAAPYLELPVLMDGRAVRPIKEVDQEKRGAKKKRKAR